jgi:hypothetical protein
MQTLTGSIKCLYNIHVCNKRLVKKMTEPVKKPIKRMVKNKNFDLEVTLLEPQPRLLGGKTFLRVRSFRTDVRAYEAANLIKNSGGLARIIKYKSYGQNSYRLYANANGNRYAKNKIDIIAHKGKVWSDW